MTDDDKARLERLNVFLKGSADAYNEDEQTKFCTFAASEVARALKALAAPGERSEPSVDVFEGCSTRLIRGFQAFEHSKAQAAAWMKTAQDTQAALALAEQEKQALRAEVADLKEALQETSDSLEFSDICRRTAGDAAVELCRSMIARVVPQSQLEGEVDRLKAALSALSPATPEPSKPEDRAELTVWGADGKASDAAKGAFSSDGCEWWEKKQTAEEWLRFHPQSNCHLYRIHITATHEPDAKPAKDAL